MESSFPAEIDQLPRILSWVRTQIEPTSLSDKEKKRVELAIEEAIVNVITHGKPAEIGLYCLSEPSERIEFILKDAGPPFNPITADENLQEDLILEEREPGGLGISIMRRYMDLLLYRREDDQNILTMIKLITY
ncbi:MAG: ATP-binding protein [Verrucomicrobia bacterium]|nr:ATP-binding protein [Verrucomicrobiota bacterium]